MANSKTFRVTHALSFDDFSSKIEFADLEQFAKPWHKWQLQDVLALRDEPKYKKQYQYICRGFWSTLVKNWRGLLHPGYGPINKTLDYGVKDIYYSYS